ncbi:hypothetical protein Acid345_3960 [Candidatus Koribacter versatilis Ellin345]|uniref:DUF2490 domain-containing protein n=1 Tax=Koribacter versatilis (strain Ellin345) TaxID=204669 RepID=Q1IJJ0_KORVE|nr:DUF2490 domain-containing protein [Candidatus Koribacter versatilis]ABF42960.1 hypothetical protein Acid345_3960 [Candidatus Koribacter versatilis Ellin345]
MSQRRALGYVLLTFAILYVLFPPYIRAQQQKPEDPEDEKNIGLWLDQAMSVPFSASNSVEVEFHQRFDEGGSRFFEHLVQTGVAFRPRPWLTVTPSYRYQRFPGNPAIEYENRLLLNLALSTSRGPWRYNLRTLVEGRFPDNRPASARLRFRPGIDYSVPLRTTWRPTVVVSNEFLVVPWFNPFANGGTSFTQNRFQVGVRLPISATLSIRPYYMLQSVNLPPGWDTNTIVGISVLFKAPNKFR